MKIATLNRDDPENYVMRNSVNSKNIATFDSIARILTGVKLVRRRKESDGVGPSGTEADRPGPRTVLQNFLSSPQPEPKNLGTQLGERPDNRYRRKKIAGYSDIISA